MGLQLTNTDLAHEAIITQGVRKRWRHWIENNQDRIDEVFNSFGCRHKRMLAIAFGGLYPDLREALVIDCITDGACTVYQWVDTEYWRAKTIAMVEGGVRTQQHSRSYTWGIGTDLGAALRAELIQRLTTPERNALHIVVHTGEHEMRRLARAKALANMPIAPVCVSDSATQEEIDRERRRYARQKARRDAYRRGTRASIDE